MHDPRSTHRLRSLFAVAVFVASAMAAGCQSSPAVAWRGARHYALGNDALDRNEPHQAILEFERAAELIPHASEVRNHLGLAYLAAGAPGSARVAFEDALELDCDNEAARVNLSRLEAAYHGAEHDLDHHLEHQPSDESDDELERKPARDLEETGRSAVHVE